MRWKLSFLQNIGNRCILMWVTKHKDHMNIYAFIAGLSLCLHKLIWRTGMFFWTAVESSWFGWRWIRKNCRKLQFISVSIVVYGTKMMCVTVMLMIWFLLQTILKKATCRGVKPWSLSSLVGRHRILPPDAPSLLSAQSLMGTSQKTAENLSQNHPKLPPEASNWTLAG